MRINIFRISSIISLVAAAMALQSMCAKTQDSLKHHSKADSILSLELKLTWKTEFLFDILIFQTI